MNYSESLKKGIDEILKNNKKAVVIGEDIGKSYGGAFKVTKGIEDKYPNQVFSTPMCESALTGIAIGMAIKGFYPILEIMFGDFITLCADQLINHASKINFLFDKNLHMVIRTPMGGYRGYGATHSQTIEKMYFGFPDIFICAPNIFRDPGKMLKQSLTKGRPVLFIENKIDYTRDLIFTSNQYDISYDKFSQSTNIKLKGITSKNGFLITYGGMASLGLEIIMEVFLKEEFSLTLIIPDMVYPLNTKIVDLLNNNTNIFILEESSKGGGFSSELSRIILEKQIFFKKIEFFSAKNKVIGSSNVLENYVLPNKNAIVQRIIKVCMNTN